VLEFGPITPDIPIATLFEVPLADVCVVPGGGAPVGGDGGSAVSTNHGRETEMPR